MGHSNQGRLPTAPVMSITMLVEPAVPIEPQVIPLSPVDWFHTAAPRLEVILCFELQADHPPPEVLFKQLCEALSKTLVSLPLFAGVVAPRENDPNPRCTDLHLSSNSAVAVSCKDYTSPENKDQWLYGPYSYLVEQHMPMDRLEAHLLAPYIPTTLDGKSPVLAAQVTFIQGGMFLTVEPSHSCVDMISVDALLTTWAKHMSTKSDIFDHSKIKVQPFDRSLIPTQAPRPERFKNPLLLDYVHEQESKIQSAQRRLAEINETLPTKRVSTSWTLTPENAKKLQEDVSSTTKFTVIEALVALMWREAALIRRMPQRNVRKSRIWFPHDIRSRLDPPAPAAYVGNAMIPFVISSKAVQLWDDEGALSLLAQSIRDTSASYTDTRVRTILSSMAAKVAVNEPLLLNYNPDSDMTLTTFYDLDIYKTDWGPTLRRCGFMRRTNESLYGQRWYVIEPCRPDGCVDIMLCSYEEELRALALSKTWTKYLHFQG